MTTALRYLLIGFLLGSATWMLLFPSWSVWLAFMLGGAYMILVFALAAAFDWVVGRWLTGKHE
jgi:hypothetical protein